MASVNWQVWQHLLCLCSQRCYLTGTTSMVSFRLGAKNKGAKVSAIPAFSEPAEESTAGRGLSPEETQRQAQELQVRVQLSEDCHTHLHRQQLSQLQLTTSLVSLAGAGKRKCAAR